MNGAHWHLVVNHLPIIFPIVGLIVMIISFIAKSEAVKRTGYAIFIIGAISAALAMATGEGAEEVVENISGISENYFETHEESAESFALVSYILGALSIVGLWASFAKKGVNNLVSYSVAAFAVVVLFLGKQTGTTGGEIRHTEIRTGFSSQPQNMENSTEEEDD